MQCGGQRSVRQHNRRGRPHPERSSQVAFSCLCVPRSARTRTKSSFKTAVEINNKTLKSVVRLHGSTCDQGRRHEVRQDRVRRDLADALSAPARTPTTSSGSTHPMPTSADSCAPLRSWIAPRSSASKAEVDREPCSARGSEGARIRGHEPAARQSEEADAAINASKALFADNIATSARRDAPPGARGCADESGTMSNLLE